MRGVVEVKWKRMIAGFLLVVLLTGTVSAAWDGGLADTAAAGVENISVDVPFAILMEKETGTVIFEKEADTQTAPASITKIMTTLLILEEMEAGRLSLEDMVTTSAWAA